VFAGSERWATGIEGTTYHYSIHTGGKEQNGPSEQTYSKPEWRKDKQVSAFCNQQESVATRCRHTVVCAPLTKAEGACVARVAGIARQQNVHVPV